MANYFWESIVILPIYCCIWEAALWNRSCCECLYYMVKMLLQTLFSCFLSFQLNVKGANFRVSAVFMCSGLGPQWRYVSVCRLNWAAEARCPLWWCCRAAVSSHLCLAGSAAELQCSAKGGIQSRAQVGYMLELLCRSSGTWDYSSPSTL